MSREAVRSARALRLAVPRAPMAWDPAGGTASCPRRPQRKGPTGGWVERGRRGQLAVTGPAVPAIVEERA
jgi:hypothetical protein